MSGVVVLDVLGGPGPVECELCHRPLIDPLSRRVRLGPICWAKTHPARTRPRRRAVMAAQAPRHPAPGDGQLELDLSVQLVLGGLP